MESDDKRSTLIPVYPSRLPVSFIKGKGIWLWSDLSNEVPYLDALSGRGVSNLGHHHPAIIKALTSQAHQLIHTSNVYRIPQQEALADYLCHIFKMQQAFFANSGAEAIEAVLKIVHRYSYQRTISQPILLSLHGSYHGRTLAALKASGAHLLSTEKAALGLESPTLQTIHIVLNDCNGLHQLVKHYQSRIVAILIEPVLGDGGIKPCDYDFLQTIRKLCDIQGYLMIADEIQTGLYRTGFLSAFEPLSIQPDITVLAKALGNGFPISAYLINSKALGLLDGYHGSTFAGNPLGCHVALTVLKTLQSEDLDVEHKGEYLLRQLNAELSHFPMIKAIRGKGLMLGIEFDHPCHNLMSLGLKHKILFDIVNTNTLRLLPPLIITLSELDALVKRLKKVLTDYESAISQ